MKGSPIGKGRSKPIRTIGQTIKKDLDLDDLSLDMIYY